MLKKSLLATLLSAASTITVASDMDISTLQAQLKAQQIQIDALVAASEKSTVSTLSPQTTIGGYGEAHYYNYENAAQQYDAYRFVLFVGHKFSDTVRLHSELEVEHGLVRDNPTGSTNLGELELEQMFIEWNYHGKQNISFGQILVPIGFLNETHEPETFYGAKRNPVETAIIPTTWWEGGVKASGLVAGVDGLSYNAVVTTGLKTDNANIRSGRQKGAKAVAEDMAYTFGFNYQGIAGLTTGVTYQLQKDISQAIGQTNEATLIEAHIGYTWQNFSTRALYAKWDIDGIATTASYAAKAKQEGYYVEAAYKPIEKLGVFARFSAWDNDAADVADSKKEQWNYGVNYYITPRVVLKLDIQDQVLPTAGLDEDGFALAVGYSF
ncbi:MAG: porin [Agitococcus sp.]|nr:porin [Agitococcus sp.]